MNYKFYKVLFFGFCITVPLISIADKPNIKIGVIAPLTGGNAIAGEDIRRVIELAKTRLESTAKKHNYSFIFEDGQCGSGSATITAVKKLIDLDRVSGLIVGCSGEILQAGPIAERAKIPTVVVYASHKDVRNLGQFIFRTWIDMERSMDPMVKLLEQEQAQKVALLTEEMPYTIGMKGLLSEKLGSRIAAAEDIPLDTTDIRQSLIKVRAKQPDAYYLNAGSAKSIALYLKQAKELGIKGPFYSYLPGEKEFLEISAAYNEGFRTLSFPEISATDPVYAKLLEDYRTRYNELPRYAFLAAATHDGVQALIDAFETVGTNADQVQGYLSSYKTQGALGTVEFDENGDVKNVTLVVNR